MGFFNPQMSDQALAVIDMMDFDSKDQVIASIQQNGSMQQAVSQLLPMTLQMAQALDATQGTNLTQAVQQMIGSMNLGGAAESALAGAGGLPGGAVPAASGSLLAENHSLGVAKGKEPANVQKARRQAAQGSNPR